MKIVYILSTALIFLLTGCLGPTKTVKVNVDQRITISAEALEKYTEAIKELSKGEVRPLVNQSISLNGIEFETGTEQTKKDITNVPISMQGGQSNVDSETENAAATQDNSLKDSANVTDPVVGHIPASDLDITDTVVKEYPFHHTQLDGPDSTLTGKSVSVVLCPDDLNETFKCSQGSLPIRYHGVSENRANYWDMRNSSNGDITCLDGDNVYIFKTDRNADKGLVFGKCN